MSGAFILTNTESEMEIPEMNKMLRENLSERNAEEIIARIMKLESELTKYRPNGRPMIICLCGSTRFYETFQEWNYLLTMEGKIVLSVGFFVHSQLTAHRENLGCTPEQKINLDELHKRKIDLADEVMILNVGGYIGESTRSELEYAKDHAKPIKYLESPES
jgi:hypothetical protein